MNINRVISGTCICKKDVIHFPFYKGKKLNTPDIEIHKGTTYTFTYKSDENGCFLYHLQNEKESQLCNWSFFDDAFEIIEEDKNE